MNFDDLGLSTKTNEKTFDVVKSLTMGEKRYAMVGQKNKVLCLTPIVNTSEGATYPKGFSPTALRPLGREALSVDSLKVGYEHLNVCRNSRIVSLKGWKSECSPRFAALFSTRGEPLRLLIPLPCPPATDGARGEPARRGLLAGSCGRNRRRVMRNRLNVGTYVPASEYETVVQNRCKKNKTSIVHMIYDTLRRMTECILS